MPNIIEIDDFNSPELDLYTKLTENQLLNRAEPDKGIFIAESPKVIERALDAGCLPVSILTEKAHLTGEAAAVLERCGDIKVFVAETELMRQLTGFGVTRGMLCAMRRPAPKSPAEVCEGARRIAVLENVMNPTNVGAIFRSAAAMGMDAVLLTFDCSNPLYRRAIRVSMGTVFQIPWAFIPKGDDLNDLLHGLGFATAAMALCDDSVSIEDERVKAEEKLAIVLGSEGEGLTEETISKSDYTVKIPMMHGVDSLNVAGASAVAFWELR